MSKQAIQKTASSKDEKPPLATLISSYDFEEIASKTLSEKAWAFYSAAATDLITRDNNKRAFDCIGFRPRILRDVTTVSTETELLGCHSSIPLFIAPVGMAKLAHPDGDKGFAKGAAKAGIIQCISTVARRVSSSARDFAS
jgi:L-lactate dehydrogenase (cytochrome)